MQFDAMNQEIENRKTAVNELDYYRAKVSK